MVSKVFPCGGDLLLVCVSSRIHLMLGFPFLDSKVILKQATETLDQGPLLYPSAIGFNECWTSSISAQRIRSVTPITTGPSGYILSSSSSTTKQLQLSIIVTNHSVPNLGKKKTIFPYTFFMRNKEKKSCDLSP